ncbi:MAG: PAS domain S-box protein, partial [Nitrospirota bacterium]
MKSEDKTKTQLLDEVDQLRRLIADLEASEAALKESEAKFHQLFDASHDVIVFLGREGNIIDINRRAEELTHYTRPELLQMDEFQNLIVPEDHALMRQVVKDAFEGRESRYVERWRTKEGEIIYFDGLTVPRRSARGEVVSTFCTLRDITEHKKADDALRESEEKFNKIVNSAFDGILIADIESKKFIFGNKAICRMLDYAPDDITKLSVYEIHPKSELPYVIGQFELQAKGVIDIAEDIPVRKKDGNVFYADIASSPVVFGDRAHLVGIFRDITER